MFAQPVWLTHLRICFLTICFLKYPTFSTVCVLCKACPMLCWVPTLIQETGALTPPSLGTGGNGGGSPHPPPLATRSNCPQTSERPGVVTSSTLHCCWHPALIRKQEKTNGKMPRNAMHHRWVTLGDPSPPVLCYISRISDDGYPPNFTVLGKALCETCRSRQGC